MIYLDLLIGFLKVGCFSFGGAYAAIPLIRDVVLSYGWLTDEVLTDMIAVSESTPGPIMVNLATYIGSSQAGLPGAILATLAVVLPAFIIILLIMAVMKTVLKNPVVQAVMRGLTGCVIGVILATGLWMVWKNGISPVLAQETDIRPLIMAVVLAVFWFAVRPRIKKKLSPILLIFVSAVFGIVIYSI